MTHNTETRWLTRLWTATVETSATAVAIHYSAPWQSVAAPPAPDRTARDTCAA